MSCVSLVSRRPLPTASCFSCRCNKRRLKGEIIPLDRLLHTSQSNTGKLLDLHVSASDVWSAHWFSSLLLLLCWTWWTMVVLICLWSEARASQSCVLPPDFSGIKWLFFKTAWRPFSRSVVPKLEATDGAVGRGVRERWTGFLSTSDYKTNKSFNCETVSGLLLWNSFRTFTVKQLQDLYCEAASGPLLWNSFRTFYCEAASGLLLWNSVGTFTVKQL